MAKIELRNISFRFGNHSVLSDFSILVEEGEFVTLLGPSGCGKSTTLNLISGLLEPTSGDVVIDGRRVNGVAPRLREVAMVFQDYALYPHMSVFENLAFPLRAAKLSGMEIRDRIERVSSTLGISDLVGRFPSDLSGGQRQRVALGRALIRNPRAFLMDEPLSNLDAKLRVAMRAELKRLHQRLRTTMIYVTHDQSEAMTLSDRIAVLWGGNLQQLGTPREVYEQPANRFVAGFVGSLGMNFVGCRPVRESGMLFLAHGTFKLAVGNGAASAVQNFDGEEIIVGLRPEHISVCEPEGEQMTGVVEVLEYLGSETLVHVRVGDEELIAKASAEVQISADSRVGIRIKGPSACLFDSKSDRLIAKGIC